MSSPHELTPEQAALEATLAGLVPRGPAVAREEFWYQAGVLAERRRTARKTRTGWYAGGLATAAGLLLATLGVMQARELGRLRSQVAELEADVPRTVGPTELVTAPATPARRSVDGQPAQPPPARETTRDASWAAGPRLSLDDLDALLEEVRPVAYRGWTTRRETESPPASAEPAPPTKSPVDRWRPSESSGPQTTREWLEELL